MFSQIDHNRDADFFLIEWAEFNFKVFLGNRFNADRTDGLRYSSPVGVVAVGGGLHKNRVGNRQAKSFSLFDRRGSLHINGDKFSRAFRIEDDLFR